MNRRKLDLTLALMGVMAVLVVVQVWRLQRFDWAAEGNLPLKNQAHVSHVITGLRGTLKDRNGQLLSQSVRSWDLFVDPAFMRSQKVDIDNVVTRLTALFGLDAQTLRRQFSSSRRFTVLLRDLPMEAVDRARQMRIPGLGIVEGQKRIWPEGHRGAQVLGLVEGAGGRGLEGIEKAFDSELRGGQGRLVHTVDIRRRPLGPAEVQKEPHKGRDVQLTFDREIMRIVDKAMQDAVAEWSPRYAMALVMDPRTGGLLACDIRPSFNPEKIGRHDIASTVNRTVAHCWEPGSILKPVIWAAALEEGLVQVDEKIDCERGAWRLPGRILHDHGNGYGYLPAGDIIVKSSNIGIAKIANRFGTGRRRDARLHDWLNRFGFGIPSDTDMPGEIVGILRPPQKWGKTSWASIPMGHEISVTPVQYLAAFNVFATGGLWVKPHVRWGGGSVPRRVLSTRTADTVAGLLHQAVERGTGKKARIKGLALAGKTGTAQKLVSIVKNGRTKFVYSHEDYVSAFASFAPVVNPRISVLIVMDEPHREGVRNPFGGTVCAPIAHKIIAECMEYFEGARWREEPLGVEP